MSDIKLIQLSNYVRPKLEENKSKNWVMNGKDNCFYQYIIDRNNGSVTNSAINKSYKDLIYGRGLSASNASTNAGKWAEIAMLLKPSELKKVISDFQEFGEAVFQVVKTKDRKKVAGIYHLAKNLTIPSIENEDGEIEKYFFCKDWSKVNKLGYEEFPVFGTSKEDIEVFVIKPYSAGCNYFGVPDYLPGLPYAEMEEEIANFCINSIRNGLSAGYIINVPDGQTMTPEEKDEFEKQIKAKLTKSSNATRFVLNFGSKDAEITVIPFPVNEQQHKQWDFLTAESRQQIMTAHRVTSPMLFGIKDNTGFGNNAEELDTAEAQLMKRVIAPKQQYILDALTEILKTNDIHLDLFFKPLTEPVKDNSTQLSSHVCCSDEKKKADLDEFISLGEYDPEGYDLIQEIEVDYEEEVKFSLATTGTANPNYKSEQDNSDIIIRYKYVGNSSPEREFCQKMMSAGKIYRKEDIIAMENKAVNPGWGPEGINNYSIWLYKGGGDCHHKWNRVIYLKKGVKIDVNSPVAEIISTSEARRSGFKVPVNANEVGVEPRNLPYNGFLPTNKRFK